MSISLVGSINSLSSDSVELVQLAEVFSPLRKDGSLLEDEFDPAP
ncbi:Uncharacterised protein [Chlamydia trachomatis]|nr:Uncharacterised protein [Chlamydia trachomatis]